MDSNKELICCFYLGLNLLILLYDMKNIVVFYFKMMILSWIVFLNEGWKKNLKYFVYNFINKINFVILLNKLSKCI